MSNTNPNEPLKPMTLWEKVKVGFSSFMKSAKDYIPHGILYATLAIGGSFLLNATLGIDPMGVVGKGVADVLLKGVGTLILGSAVTGTIGAYHGISNASQQRNAEIEWQQRGVQVSPRALGQQRQRTAGGPAVARPQMDLPGRQPPQGQRIAPSM